MSRAESRYQLARHWNVDDGVPPEHFELASLSHEVCPLRVSIIQHHYPCIDSKPEWLEHENGAEALIGVVFPTDAARTLPTVLKQPVEPWLQYVEGQEFFKRYGTGIAVALRVRVRSLEMVSKAPQRNGCRYLTVGNVVIVGGGPKFTCSWEFVE